MTNRKWHFYTVLLIAVVSLTGGCMPAKDNRSQQSDTDDKKGTLVLTSSAFENGKAIPKKYTGQGEDLSPPLTLPKAPAGTKTWALICDDPDAPSPKKPGPKPWVHWVIYNIPADCTELPAGIPRSAEPDTPAGARQAINSFSKDNIGYRGPMPPQGSGAHRYIFKLYALDTELDLGSKAGKDELLAAMKGHILDQGQLMGTYEIPK